MPASKTVSTAQLGDQSAAAQRRVPDMQVVTKGWWTLRQERQPVEALEQQDRAERKQA